jgi:hypothetical protein
MTDQLGAALRDLATELEFPPTPDVRRTIGARLNQPPRRAWSAWRWSRPVVIVAIAVVLMAATAAVLVLPGLRITLVPTLPPASVPTDALGTRLALGEPQAPGTLDVAPPSELGQPDEAYLSQDGEVLSLVYAADDELPELANTGIGLLVQRIHGSLDRERVEKLVVEFDVTVMPVEVDGAEGFWIAGPPHVIRYTDALGAERSEMTRLVGDTLVWQRGDVLYRIESGLGLTETRRIAESIE